MAIYHLSAAVGSKASGQSAAAKFDYVCRVGKFTKGVAELAHAESGNMPAWAKENPVLYWQAADQHERANGRLFQQVEIALPRELREPQRIVLAVEFAKALAETPDGSLPYTVAVHRGKGTNPHAHIVLSERALDGHDRTAETWFKRVASAPRQKGESDEQYQERQSKIDFSKGGARKSIAFQSPDWIGEVRQQWAERANHALDQAKVQERIDHRSHSDRGLQELPTVHVGPRVRAVGKDDRAATNEEIRAANVELAKARTELDLFRKQLAAMLREFLAEIREQFKRVRGLQRQLTEQREKSAAEAQKLQAAVDWFVKHGLADPLKEPKYQNQPWIVAAHAKDFSTYTDYAKTPADKARWIESGQVLSKHLAEKRYVRLKEKYPNETEQRLRRAADGLILKTPLGKSQEHGKNRSRGERLD